MVTQPQTNIDHPWDRAAATVLTRVSGLPGRGEESLDTGVNFFVLALEGLGAKPRFSCEGHPRGFYITFDASYELALEIRKAGYFAVELEGLDYWSLRRTSGELFLKRYTEKNKVDSLRSAADGWLRFFGDRLIGLSVATKR
jgi:hypothetical protein